ncbi:MAG: leucine-rich repeat domain-containing protein [Aurantibacter sp.]
MKKTAHPLLIFGVLLVLLWACSKDDGPAKPDPVQQPDPVVEPVQKSGDKQMISFRFTEIDADGITVDISADIDEQANAITATMPSGTEITALEPTVEISPKATLDPNGPQDFTTPINYKVTAEDGTSKTYLATLAVALSQKEILLIISNANPDNTLEWKEEDNLNDWEEVTLDGDGNIAELDLGDKGLIYLSPEIGQLGSLKMLDLNNNNLSTLPPEIGNLNALDSLDLDDNNLSILPPEIGQLSSLEFLDLDDNNLSTLAPETGQLGSLEFLDLDGNNLNTLPPEIGQLGNLNILDLHDNNLSALPPEIGQLAELQSLDLEDNNLSALPPEIGQLANLKFLGLFGNALAALPIEMTQLVNLTFLDLRNNNLSNFNHISFISSGPVTTIGCVTETNLEFLYLAGNADLEVLDECICNLDLNLGGDLDIDVVPNNVKCVGDVITGK